MGNWVLFRVLAVPARDQILAEPHLPECDFVYSWNRTNAPKLKQELRAHNAFLVVPSKIADQPQKIASIGRVLSQYGDALHEKVDLFFSGTHRCSEKMQRSGFIGEDIGKVGCDVFDALNVDGEYVSMDDLIIVASISALDLFGLDGVLPRFDSSMERFFRGLQMTIIESSILLQVDSPGTPATVLGKCVFKGLFFEGLLRGEGETPKEGGQSYKQIYRRFSVRRHLMPGHDMNSRPKAFMGRMFRKDAVLEGESKWVLCEGIWDRFKAWAKDEGWADETVERWPEPEYGKKPVGAAFEKAWVLYVRLCWACLTEFPAKEVQPAPEVSRFEECLEPPEGIGLTLKRGEAVLDLFSQGFFQEKKFPYSDFQNFVDGLRDSFSEKVVEWVQGKESLSGVIEFVRDQMAGFFRDGTPSVLNSDEFRVLGLRMLVDRLVRFDPRKGSALSCLLPMFFEKQLGMKDNAFFIGRTLEGFDSISWDEWDGYYRNTCEAFKRCVQMGLLPEISGVDWGAVEISPLDYLLMVFAVFSADFCVELFSESQRGNVPLSDTALYACIDKEVDMESYQSQLNFFKALDQMGAQRQVRTNPTGFFRRYEDIRMRLGQDFENAQGDRLMKGSAPLNGLFGGEFQDAAPEEVSAHEVLFNPLYEGLVALVAEKTRYALAVSKLEALKEGFLYSGRVADILGQVESDFPVLRAYLTGLRALPLWEKLGAHVELLVVYLLVDWADLKALALQVPLQDSRAQNQQLVVGISQVLPMIYQAMLHGDDSFDHGQATGFFGPLRDMVFYLIAQSRAYSAFNEGHCVLLDGIDCLSLPYDMVDYVAPDLVCTGQRLMGLLRYIENLVSPGSTLVKTAFETVYGVHVDVWDPNSIGFLTYRGPSAEAEAGDLGNGDGSLKRKPPVVLTFFERLLQSESPVGEFLAALFGIEESMGLWLGATLGVGAATVHRGETSMSVSSVDSGVVLDVRQNLVVESPGQMMMPVIVWYSVNLHTGQVEFWKLKPMGYLNSGRFDEAVSRQASVALSLLKFKLPPEVFQVNLKGDLSGLDPEALIRLMGYLMTLRESREVLLDHGEMLPEGVKRRYVEVVHEVEGQLGSVLDAYQYLVNPMQAWKIDRPPYGELLEAFLGDPRVLSMLFEVRPNFFEDVIEVLRVRLDLVLKRFEGKFFSKTTTVRRKLKTPSVSLSSGDIMVNAFRDACKAAKTVYEREVSVLGTFESLRDALRLFHRAWRVRCGLMDNVVLNGSLRRRLFNDGGGKDAIPDLSLTLRFFGVRLGFLKKISAYSGGVSGILRAISQKDVDGWSFYHGLLVPYPDEDALVRSRYSVSSSEPGVPSVFSELLRVQCYLLKKGLPEMLLRVGYGADDSCRGFSSVDQLLDMAGEGKIYVQGGWRDSDGWSKGTQQSENDARLPVLLSDMLQVMYGLEDELPELETRNKKGLFSGVCLSLIDGVVTPAFLEQSGIPKGWAEIVFRRLVKLGKVDEFSKLVAEQWVEIQEGADLDLGELPDEHAAVPEDLQNKIRLALGRVGLLKKCLVLRQFLNGLPLLRVVSRMMIDMFNSLGIQAEFLQSGERVEFLCSKDALLGPYLCAKVRCKINLPYPNQKSTDYLSSYEISYDLRFFGKGPPEILNWKLEPHNILVEGESSAYWGKNVSEDSHPDSQMAFKAMKLLQMVLYNEAING